MKTYLGQSRSKDALVVAKVSLAGACLCVRLTLALALQELMESQPRSARALVVMVRAVAAAAGCVILQRNAVGNRARCVG